MNLTIADAPGLVAFLHEIITTLGKPVLAAKHAKVSDVRGQFFSHGQDPISVGGPYSTLVGLVRAEGRRRYAELPIGGDGEPLFEVVDWQGLFFSIAPSSDGLSEAQSSISAAMCGDRGSRVIHREADVVEAPGLSLPRLLALLRRSSVTDQSEITVNGRVVELQVLQDPRD